MGICKKWPVLAVAACGLSLWGAAAQARAQDVVSLDDLQIVYQPRARPYTPQGNMGADDAGKDFVITCAITDSGHVQNCRAEDNDIEDEGFVEAALSSVRRWVVGRHLKSGEPSAGLSFEVTCRVDRVDQGPENMTIAMAGNDWK